MKNYVYVPRNKYKDFNREILSIIKNVRAILRNKYKFQSHPVGSLSVNMITWEDGYKKGFDLDYSLILQDAETELPSSIHNDFANAIRKSISQRGFVLENHTHVLKIKKSCNCTVGEFSCDFAIMFDNGIGTHILTYDKNNDVYIWTQVAKVSNIKEKLETIRCNGFAGELRKEYLTLKKNDGESKHSYLLRIEAINNVFSHFNLG